MQQQRYRTPLDPRHKRPFEQISSAQTRDESFITASSFLKPSVPLYSGPRRLPQQPRRLIASTISSVNDPKINPAHETNCTGHVPWKPSSSLNPLLELSHPRYGLPDSLVKNFASLGIKYIYPWQSSCLLGRGLLTGEKNFVYTAPTGGGKSLVADVLMLKRVLESPHTKAMLVLPYVALVQEKVNWLRRAVDGVDKIFDANMLVNTAIEQCTIDDLGIVILDELHMIDDDHRGYLMEILATKILSLERSVQIVGMSATLPNTQLLAEWLDAKYYESKFKPVAMDEYLVLNAVVALAVETASEGYGALVFCGSRQACQKTALLVSQAMPDGDKHLRQMRGRAGRKGKDEIGESFLCCQSNELDEVMQVINANLPQVESSMKREKRGIKRALLEVLTIRLATHAGAIDEYVRRTLLHHSMDKDELRLWVETTMKELQSTGQIRIDATGSYEATPLARATVGSCMTPEDGVFVHDELQRALRAFVMDGEMHVFYMFTPINIWGIGDINWRIFRGEVDGLDESGMRVLDFVGISPAANSGRQLPEDDEEQRRVARVHRRFYAAFQLRDLCHEVPIPTIARKYEVARGLVQTLAQTCEGYAAGMISFCDIMGWGMLKSVLEHMSDRLKAGARADLLDLARIPFVKSRTARVFWENGLRTLRAVAEVEAKDLVPLLLLVIDSIHAQEQQMDIEADI
ncbi:MAG: hypothetical protein Q9200_003695 [Gallowayella weberi]